MRTKCRLQVRSEMANEDSGKMGSSQTWRAWNAGKTFELDQWEWQFPSLQERRDDIRFEFQKLKGDLECRRKRGCSSLPHIPTSRLSYGCFTRYNIREVMWKSGLAGGRLSLPSSCLTLSCRIMRKPKQPQEGNKRAGPGDATTVPWVLQAFSQHQVT